MNRIKSKIYNLIYNRSIRSRITFIFTAAALIIFAVNILIFIKIDIQLQDFDDVYSGNEYNNHFSDVVDGIQENLNDYMMTKSTSSMEEYYRLTEELRSMSEDMNYSVNDESILMLQKDVINIADFYLELTEDAVQNKRGRNILKYKESFDKATKMYGYLNDYIYSLNTAQFQQNTEHYSDVRKSMRMFEILSIIIMALITIAEFVITSYLTRHITTPLNNLAKKAEEISNGNLDVEIPAAIGKDEVATLSAAFSKMIDGMKIYMENEKKSIEEKRDIRERELKMKAKVKDAELRYYQSQIDPHFLFNTLNAGMQLAMLENAPRTTDYVENVAHFFRYNLKKDNGITTLAEELELVDYYMAILNVRFGGEITLEKNIEESLCHVSMPKMILQPLVENAVNHGIRDIEWKGKIYLTVYKSGGDVIISIADNGKGMKKEVLQSVLDGTYVKPKGEHGNGVGMKNIISRLRLCFNRDDVFELISEGEDKGLEVLIHVPYDEEVMMPKSEA